MKNGVGSEILVGKQAPQKLKSNTQEEATKHFVSKILNLQTAFLCLVSYIPYYHPDSPEKREISNHVKIPLKHTRCRSQ